ncbi:hypothetical protein [Comamonas piscis]
MTLRIADASDISRLIDILRLAVTRIVQLGQRPQSIDSAQPAL